MFLGIFPFYNLLSPPPPAFMLALYSSWLSSLSRRLFSCDGKEIPCSLGLLVAYVIFKRENGSFLIVDH